MQDRVSFGEALRVWAKIGLLGFGGPAGQIALMHRELVEKRAWIDEERFLHALSYCTLLPGPEATQLATYVGWLLHRTRGGIAAGVLFVLPGYVAILSLSVLYTVFHDLPAITSLFFGLKAAVVALVVEALHRIGKRALRNRLFYGIAALAFVALFFFDVPFPIVVATAGSMGLVGVRLVPDAFAPAKRTSAAGPADSVVARMAARGELAHTTPSRAKALRVLVVCLALWIAPLVALAARFGTASVYFEEGVLFSKAAMSTFGGAYAVLAYVAQRAVETYGWLRPGEMLDGLGLAETTPGPLIIVVQFVGFLGAYRHPVDLSPLASGILGATVTVWVTFVPCFFWIFLGAPYVEALRGNARLAAALSAIMAAVVGVILNLSVWFGLHVVFRHVVETHHGPLRLLVPDVASVDLFAAALAAGALVALLRFKASVPATLGACGTLGVVVRLWG